MPLWRTISLAALGLVAGLVAEMLAMGLGAAGHGWIAPVFLSVPLLILYPLTLTRMHGPIRMAQIERLTVSLAAVLDVLLLWSCLAEGAHVLVIWTVGPQFVLCWLVLWFGWQAAAIIGLKRRYAVRQPNFLAGRPPHSIRARRQD